MNIDTILARLTKAKPVANGWIACCPAHEDRQPSMTLREAENGVILMHCHAGCDTENILRALGIEFSDLYAEPLAHHLGPIPPALRFPAAAVLECVAKEALIVSLIAADMNAGRTPAKGDAERLQLATKRLAEAVEVIRGT